MPGRTPIDEVREALRACRLWRAASDAAVDRLAMQADLRAAPAGTVLAAEGDAADTFGVVVRGSVRVAHLGADGRRITLETVGAGEAFGAVVVLAGGRYPFHVETATDASIAWLRRGALDDLLTAEPSVARDVIGDLANRVVALTSVVQTLALDVPARLARYLFQRALATGTPVPEGVRIDLGMAKSELAATLGTVPETLSRAFARLKSEGIVEMRGSSVTIRDVRALATLGSGYSEG